MLTLSCRDSLGRLCCEVVAIDALVFHNDYNRQFKKQSVLRELNKVRPFTVTAGTFKKQAFPGRLNRTVCAKHLKVLQLTWSLQQPSLILPSGAVSMHILWWTAKRPEHTKGQLVHLKLLCTASSHHTWSYVSVFKIIIVMKGICIVPVLHTKLEPRVLTVTLTSHTCTHACMLAYTHARCFLYVSGSVKMSAPTPMFLNKLNWKLLWVCVFKKKGFYSICIDVTSVAVLLRVPSKGLYSVL